MDATRTTIYRNSILEPGWNAMPQAKAETTLQDFDTWPLDQQRSRNLQARILAPEPLLANGVSSSAWLADMEL